MTHIYTRAGVSTSVFLLSTLGLIGPAAAQGEQDIEEVIVRGLRSSLESAQNLKREANSVVDSIVADDIGKLPDRSIAEAIQRIPGVAVSRFDQPADPEHFAGEGAGVSIRGLPQVRAELNGRDIFSASDGRSLSFDDVPAELMSAVDVHKTPTADMIEGGLGGIVNLRTRMPFDSEDMLLSGTVKANYADNIDEWNPEASVLYSNNWTNSAGRFGMLIDLSTSEISSRADNLYNRAFFPRDDIEDDRVWVTKGSDWRRNDYNRTRSGQYLALQWSPGAHLETYVTALRSEATREWYENAFFLDAGVYPLPPDNSDWVYDENSALVSGTLTSPAGIALGTSSRVSKNESTTTDISAGATWFVNQWTVSADLQQVKSTAERNDYTLGTVIFPEQIYVSGLDNDDGPTIVDVDNNLRDLDNYSYGQMMTWPVKNEAESTAARVDAEYAFEDSIVSAVKAGVRYARKEADNREAFSWSARVQPWNLSAWGDDVPKITDASLMQAYEFDNFQRGDAQVPLSAWMYKREALNDFAATTQTMAATTQPPAGSEWATSLPDFAEQGNLNYAPNKNIQEETSNAAYIRVDFALSDRFGGNAGLRYVKTENTASGYFQAPGLTVGDEQIFAFPSEPISAKNSYNSLLPSMNLRFDATDNVVLRFSASKGIWKPEFERLKAVWTLDVGWNDAIPEDQRPTDADQVTRDMVKINLTSNETNPYLRPMQAKQYDLSAEWYFNDAGGALTAALFKKDVYDYFRVQSYSIETRGLNATATNVINTGTADVQGIEIGGSYYFDFLPAPFDGFGVTGNMTLVDSSTELPTQEGTTPTDTDGSPINDLPLEGLAERTYNLALMYEKDRFFVRLAYNYASEILQSIGPNGWNGTDQDIVWKLPVFADAYSQWDLSMGYDITDQLTLNLEAYNLGKSKTKGIMKQNQAGEHPAFVYSQDTRYGVSLRFTF
ncbi:TonB-dependent receptor [Teredinibacter turnerae]|uniref:TonB-dependent receptor n=1 Tax=Teredinibacter turnerae TaxID=2426 RepID=UPI0005F7D67D|nr:TonB-dependent receptor [Teredinibacter turnerae]